MCSNPEPADLSETPLGSIEYARYLLAQAEVEMGVRIGIAQGLRAAIGGRAIPSMEIGLRHARVVRTILDLDADGLNAALPSWLDSQIFLKANGAALREQDPKNPSYGEIPPCTSEELRSPLAAYVIEDTLMSFGIAASLRCDTSALELLNGNLVRDRTDNIASLMLQTMSTGEVAGSYDRLLIAIQIYRTARASTLTPEQLFASSVRFVQAATNSNFKRTLAPLLEKWCRERWQYVIEQQRFELWNPRMTVPPIEVALASPDTGLRYVGKLILAIEPALKATLDASLRSYMLAL
jgi:hypothetical protein